MIFILEVYPRVFGEMFERKIDSLFVRFKADNFKLDFLTFFDEIFWPGDMPPRHIVDMKKTIEAA